MITFVSHTNKAGGGELALRRYLEVTKLSVRLVTMERGGVWEGLPTEVLHAPGLPRLRQALRGSNLIVANSMRAAFLTALVMPRRTQLVYWVRDGLVDSAMSPIALALTKHITARRTWRYLANSEWTARTIHPAVGGTRAKIDVIQSMCGVKEPDLARPARQAPEAEMPLRLLFIGRLSPWKAPHVAVQALAPLRDIGIDASLTIAGESLFGEDAYADKLASLAAAESGVTLVGHVDDVVGLLDNHDVLVHCSTFPEPFGQVIVQGLAAGIPVLASAHGGPVELLGDAPAQLLYQPGDPYRLALGVQRAVANYSILSSWSLQRARTLVDSQALVRTDAVMNRLATQADVINRNL